MSSMSRRMRRPRIPDLPCPVARGDCDGASTGTHTPGPWKIRQSPGGEITIAAGNLYVADCMLGAYYRDRSETQANARLIASAPALLEALRALVLLNPQCCNHTPSNGIVSCGDCAVCRAQAAIGAAEGEAGR